jgi:dTDP-4-amino-4,6-dideoxy-D-galactose acyltransferase
MIYHQLDWDSQFFGYKIAAIRAHNLELNALNNAIGELAEQGYKLAYCFARPDDEISNSSMLSASGLLVDKKITFFMRINEADNFTIPPFDNIKSYKLNSASEKLKSLALQSGIYSRFRIDPNFHNAEYERLYLVWIEKSVQRKIADEVLVYFENEKELGLITLGIKEDTGSIGLLAVDEEERGKSIGRKLVQSALVYFRKKKANIVEVVTQNDNKGASGFYKSMGFEVKSIVNIYHLWIS